MDLVNQTMVIMVGAILAIPLVFFIGQLIAPRRRNDGAPAAPKKVLWQEIDPSIAELINQQQEAKNSPDYVAGLLNRLIGRKDRVTGEIFQPGEEIYVCFRCELGYHEDSWEFLAQQCEQCGAIAPKIQKISLPIPAPSLVPARDHQQGTLGDSSASDSQEVVEPDVDPSKELEPESIAAIEPSSDQPTDPSPAISPQATPQSLPEPESIAAIEPSSDQLTDPSPAISPQETPQPSPEPESIPAIEPSSDQPADTSPAISPQETPQPSPEIDNP